MWSSQDASRGWCSEAEAGGAARATEGDIRRWGWGARVPSSLGPGVPSPHLPREVIAGLGRRSSGSLRDVQEGCSPTTVPRPCASGKPTARPLPHHPDLHGDPPLAASPPSKAFTPCGGRLPAGGGGGSSQGGLGSGWSCPGGGRGRGPRGPGVHSRCGAQGHTDTRRPRAGAGQPSRCHRPPWNRKGWFHSPHRRSRRQSAGRLTGCSPPLGTGAWDSTTSNSMKGACRKRGGRLPTRPRARLPLPQRTPRSLGARAPPPPGGGRSPVSSSDLWG